MLERDIIIAIKIYLASLGSDVFFWKEHGGPYGTSGIPDIICCYKGRFLGLEAKLPGGKLTALQRRALEKINAAGGIGRRVESVDDVKAVIAQADRERSRENDCEKSVGIEGRRRTARADSVTERRRKKDAGGEHRARRL